MGGLARGSPIGFRTPGMGDDRGGESSGILVAGTQRNRTVAAAKPKLKAAVE